jgi:hypothetical protein
MISNYVFYGHEYPQMANHRQKSTPPERHRIKTRRIQSRNKPQNIRANKVRTKHKNTNPRVTS